MHRKYLLLSVSIREFRVGAVDLGAQGSQPIWRYIPWIGAQRTYRLKECIAISGLDCGMTCEKCRNAKNAGMWNEFILSGIEVQKFFFFFSFFFFFFLAILQIDFLARIEGLNDASRIGMNFKS